MRGLGKHCPGSRMRGVVFCGWFFIWMETLSLTSTSRRVTMLESRGCPAPTVGAIARTGVSYPSDGGLLDGLDLGVANDNLRCQGMF